MATRPRVMTTAEIMRANPHPVTTFLKARGWNDADPHPWRPQVDYDWDADGWLPTWRVTRARLETSGLIVTIREASVEAAREHIELLEVAEEEDAEEDMLQARSAAMEVAAAQAQAEDAAKVKGDARYARVSAAREAGKELQRQREQQKKQRQEQ